MDVTPRVVALTALLAACAERPSDRQLEAWRAEAQAANRDKVEAAARQRGDEAGRALNISGQTRSGRMVLPWRQIDAMATRHVTTVSPHNTADRDRPIDFRGVLVRDLLDRTGVGEGVTELTFVSIDAFRAAVSVVDARRFRMLLAIEAD